MARYLIPAADPVNFLEKPIGFTFSSKYFLNIYSGYTLRILGDIEVSKTLTLQAVYSSGEIDTVTRNGHDTHRC